MLADRGDLAIDCKMAEERKNFQAPLALLDWIEGGGSMKRPEIGSSTYSNLRQIGLT